MRKALEPILLAWSVPDLRRRLLFVIAASIFYVFSINIPLPHVNHENVERLW